jgi:hypothetical protein
VDLGDLAAGGTRDLSYKLNCAAPSAVRFELEWQDGRESYLKTAEQALPQPASATAGRPLLLVLQPAFEHDAKKKVGTVRFWLRNDGDQPGTEVKQTIVLKDSAGKILLEHAHVPEKGTIAPGYAQEQVVSIPKCPAFSNIAVKTSTAEDRQVRLDPGKFSAKKELQVAQFACTGGKLSARVRNGQETPVNGLLILFHLLDAQGAVLHEVPAAVGDLAPGEERAVEVAAPEVKNLAGWGYAYETGMGSAPADGEAPAAAPAALGEIEVDGIALRLSEVAEVPGGMSAAVTIDNRRQEDLHDLICTVTIEDAGGTRREIRLDLGELGEQRSWQGAVQGAGMSGISSVQLTWKAGKKP